MILLIKDIIKNYGINGDIVLYRDEKHRKEGLMQYLKDNLLIEGKIIVTYSDGAFGLFLARALPDNQVITHFKYISPDYGELMKKQSNLTLIYDVKGTKDWKENYLPKYNTDEYLIINQFEEDIITEYYKNYFPTMIDVLKVYDIDAFCDCGHSCQTMAGFIRSNEENKFVDWKFILGINRREGRENLWKLNQYKGLYEESPTFDFDTLQLGKEIEEKYPYFGNVYEATRSISAAMAWLKTNPGKTVAIYVGDAYKKEGTKFGQDK